MKRSGPAENSLGRQIPVMEGTSFQKNQEQSNINYMQKKKSLSVIRSEVHVSVIMSFSDVTAY